MPSRFLHKIAFGISIFACLGLVYYSIFLITISLITLSTPWFPTAFKLPAQTLVICVLFHYFTIKIVPQLTHFFKLSPPKLQLALRELTPQFAKAHSLEDLHTTVKINLHQILGVKEVILDTTLSIPSQNQNPNGLSIPIYSTRNELISHLLIGPKTTNTPYSSQEHDFLKIYAKELSTPLQNILFLKALTQQLQILQDAQNTLLASERKKIIAQTKEKNVRDLTTLIMKEIHIPLQDIENALSELNHSPHAIAPELYRQLKEKCRQLYLVTKNFLDAELKKESPQT